MSNKKSFSVVQMNDSHAYFDLHQEMFWQAEGMVYRPAGGYARIAVILNEIRSQSQGEILFCDCGDTLHGTYAALQTQGQALIPILNSLDIDAMTAHWEFAYGPKIFQERADELNYPMLAANIYDQDSKKLLYPAYRIKEIKGLRIGIIGVACNIVDKTMPPSFSEGIFFTLGREELPPIIHHLRTEKKADLIVLLSHLGFPQDMKLLSEVSGIDICLSGHTHNRLSQPAINGKTIVIQSGCHGSFLGHLELEIENGKIDNWRHRLIEVEAGIEPDNKIEQLVRDALAPYQKELDEVVGQTATALNRGTILEATMDNFLLQSLLELTGAQLAFSNGWRYGAPITPGKITQNDLYNIIPVNPPVSTVQLAGEEIKMMLEENLEKTFSRDPYQQMGGYVKRSYGLKVYFKIENPAGQRIQKIFVGSRELKSEKSYDTVFVTMQGVPEKYGVNRENRSERAIDALKAYLAKHHSVSAELQGSFVVV